MHGIKDSCSMREEYNARMLQCSCESQYYSVPDRSFWSFSGDHEDLLNETPRISYYNPSLHLHLERKLSNQKCFCSHEMTSARSTVSNETSSPTIATELVKEITNLELEIVNLEHYLLSLYRTAFEYYMKDSPVVFSENARHSSFVERQKGLISYRGNYSFQSYSSLGDTTDSHCFKNNEKDALGLWQKQSFPTTHLQCDPENKVSHAPSCIPQKDVLEGASVHHNHEDEVDNPPIDPCKLSEDILRCIAAIYCKLAVTTTRQKEKVILRAASLCSSSTFSRQSSSENWSPGCQSEAAVIPFSSGWLNDRQAACDDMIEILQISVDSERFGYASMMLNTFRTLIKKLKTIDPRKMDYLHQMAFWLNIHNALVMHAFLAYGLRLGRMKSMSSVLKAAYNVGGHSVNAYVIQSSIIGCQPHCSAPLLEALLSPALKFLRRKHRHIYALEHPHPLVHFAICQGAYSDPAVRAFTGKNVLQDLELAMREFIQSNVKIKRKRKIIIPKILSYYMRDGSFETSKLLRVVAENMPEMEKGQIQQCLRGSCYNCIIWSQYNSSFRFMIHRDLAKL
ncbi:hypothetical protein AXF42_Ash015344 [Apostasia shenzhenica]|uniref:DUF547 domain-containing protein n=1 Tax=Apostasia shenzhenica TaxID=1088818 RepID=A0A2I0ALX7_9ASPA|nr:hypothetical protein AXF42_Ash015344 [Apostasia shenzhenica]